jgi:hypothetical protein
MEETIMRVAGVREIRENLAALLGGHEPVLVTRHGKLSGLYLPLDDPDRIPTDLRREMALVLGRHLAALLATNGVTEQSVQKDFNTYRRGRLRR